MNEEFTIKVRAAEEKMDESERLEFWATIMQGYCRECGAKDPNGTCQCANDE